MRMKRKKRGGDDRFLDWDDDYPRREWRIRGKGKT